MRTKHRDTEQRSTERTPKYLSDAVDRGSFCSLSLLCLSFLSLLFASVVRLVIEHKLARVEQGPEDVIQRLLLIRFSGDQCCEPGLFFVRRLTARAAEGQLLDDLRCCLLLRQTPAGEVAGGD